MARGDPSTVPHKKRKLEPSASVIDPNSIEYNHIFSGLVPPVVDDNTPETRKILDEWRAYVVHHYLLFVDSQRKQRRSRTPTAFPSSSSSSSTRPIDPDPKMDAAEQDVQMDDEASPLADTDSNMGFNTSSLPHTLLQRPFDTSITV